VTYNRAEVIDQNFLEFLEKTPTPPAAVCDPAQRVHPDSRLTGGKLLELFESMLVCRHLDLAARVLRARDQGYYTIASTGHEGNCIVGDVLRDTDPTFLHYRSGALMVQRARKAPELDIVRDTLLGVCAAAEDPTSGGRHKVWGSKRLWVPPQTSTIGSHLPKAVGCALGIDRGARLGLPEFPIPADSIACCTFGDATVNHSTSQGSLNAANWLGHQKIPVPILFVCEDNGWGISVPTPPRWIEKSVGGREGLTYFTCDGTDLPAAYETVSQAVEACRSERQPVFLHLRMVRLLGHAGSDIEREYRSVLEIEEAESRDPLIVAAGLVIASGLLSADEIRQRYEAIRARVLSAADEVAVLPKLETPAAVAASLAPFNPESVAAEAKRPMPANEKMPKLPLGRQRHLASMINRGLFEALGKYDGTIVFGEDVARKGGVYHVTAGLWKAYGAGRVFNTLLDETSILGLASGAAHVGFLPIAEIQYLAYLHNAEDQLRGEAASLQYFSADQFRNPMVVRIASYAYQKGFGGHFHNDNSVAVLRDVPGLVIASPSRGDDAVKMLRTCLALAKADGRVVAYLEPIALYMTKDLHEEGDGGWLCDFPEQGEAIPLGEGRVYNDDAYDMTIVSYANGLYRSLRAAKTLQDEHGIAARVVDLRWLQPLNLDLVEREALHTGRLLVVDECRRSGGPGEAILAGVAERCGGAVTCSLLAGEDCFIPLGPAMDVVLPNEERIVDAALRLHTRSARVRS
jgi:2-oxoisovalerate dehydrogenase E1 component